MPNLLIGLLLAASLNASAIDSLRAPRPAIIPYKDSIGFVFTRAQAESLGLCLADWRACRTEIREAAKSKGVWVNVKNVGLGILAGMALWEIVR